MQKFIFVFLLIFILIISCQQQQPLSPANIDLQQLGLIADSIDYEDSLKINIMTRNIYVGTDVDTVLTATDPTQIPQLVAYAFQMLLSTDFPERAKVLAKEIKVNKPDLVGLQEVSIIRTQSPGDAIIGGTIPAEDTLFNYLEILLAELYRQGMDYYVAGIIQNSDVELPMYAGMTPPPNPQPMFDDVRLTDFDVVLARHDVVVSNVLEDNFVARLIIPIDSTTSIEIPRGFVAVDAEVRGKNYRFVNTHLEAFFEPIRVAQAQELLTALQGDTLTTIVVGDFNSVAPVGPAYNLMLSANFRDMWDENRRSIPWQAGNTFGHDPDLRNKYSNMYERIDFIFVRPHADYLNEPILSVAKILGIKKKDKTKTGLWPSDHAGIAAKLKIPHPGFWWSYAYRNME
jgi:endonuclease/exonuclease/phosphatase family metal-dependent hydrolase